MRSIVPALALALFAAPSLLLAGCNGCSEDHSPSQAEREKALASALAAPPPPPSAEPEGKGIGHPANVIPGKGPKRIEFDAPRMGIPLPILPGQGVGPIRFGATKATIERLMGAPCDDVTETLCRYVGKGAEFKLQGDALNEIKISRKGREAKRAPDGSIIEYGFFNGAFLPDLYFGMQPSAMQEQLGAPTKVEKVEPLGADGFAERHFYDGVTLEYDLWSNGKLILGAAILTKSATAAAKNDKLMDELTKKAQADAELAKKTRPTIKPR